MQWLQDTKQSNVDKLNNIRHKASRLYRNKKKEYLRTKIDKIETKSKIENADICMGASMILRRITSLQ